MKTTTLIGSGFLALALSGLGCASGGGGGRKDASADGAQSSAETGFAPAADADGDGVITIPFDTGTSPSDTVSIPFDLGAPPQDAPIDPGLPPVDLGTPPADTGVLPPPQPVTGGLLVLQVEYPGKEVASVAARFRYGPPPQPTVTGTFGTCQVIPSTGGDAPPDTTTGIDAGTIVVKNLSQPVTLSPVPGAHGLDYQSGLPASQKSILSAQPKLLASATGGKNVPAFGGEVAVPGAVQVTKPSGGSVSKSSALQVSWNAGQGDEVRIDVFVADLDGPKSGNALVCTTKDTGSFTVPSGAMKVLPGGGGGFPIPISDLVIVGVTRIKATEIATEVGTVTLAVSRSNGAYATLD